MPSNVLQLPEELNHSSLNTPDKEKLIPTTSCCDRNHRPSTKHKAHQGEPTNAMPAQKKGFCTPAAIRRRWAGLSSLSKGAPPAPST